MKNIVLDIINDIKISKERQDYCSNGYKVKIRTFQSSYYNDIHIIDVIQIRTTTEILLTISYYTEFVKIAWNCGEFKEYTRDECEFMWEKLSSLDEEEYFQYCTVLQDEDITNYKMLEVLHKKILHYNEKNHMKSKKR